jgi:hypothetical protein
MAVGLYPIVTFQYSSTILFYTRFPIIFSTCFSKVTIGYYPTRQVKTVLSGIRIQQVLWCPYAR